MNAWIENETLTGYFPTALTGYFPSYLSGHYPNGSSVLQGWMCPMCGFVNSPLSSICANSVYIPIGTSGHWSHS